MTTAQITRETRDASTIDATPAASAWTITQDGDTIAELVVAQHNGEILWVWTHEEHRDNGHATALYQAARADLDGRIYHAPDGHRTDDGDRFAARVGGETLTCTCCIGLDDEDDWNPDRED